MDMMQIMKQAREMQTRMQQMQEQLGEIEVEGSAGGGMVKVVMTCKRDVKALEIAPELLNPDDRQTIQDLLIAALNVAGQNAESRLAEETRKMMQDLGLPADFQLPM